MNILQLKFKESDIPYDSFQKLGIAKMDILSLDKKNLEHLLSGKRTDLFNIRGVDSKGENFEFKGKFSLTRNPDNTVGLMVHPVRQDIKNDINLNPKEIEKLKGGELITKSIGGERYLVQLDRETNEILKAKTKNINIPSHIKDVELNATQKEKMRQGQIITIKSGKDELQVSLDLNNPKGLRLTNDAFDQKQKLDFDRLNPQFIGVEQTDKNRAEYTQYQKSQNNSLNVDLNIKNGFKPKLN